MSCVGAGALVGALALSNRKSHYGLSKLMVVSGFCACFAVALLALATNLYISAFFVLICGFCMMMQAAGANIVIQSLVTDEMRGRVMSLYSLAFFGFMPFGSLIAGSLSNLAGVKYTLLFSASAIFIASLLLRKKLMNIL
jgi:MFS family permease